MIQRPATLSQIQIGQQRSGHVIFGLFYRRFHLITSRQIAGNRCGKGAAGAMGVGIINFHTGKPDFFAACVILNQQKIIGTFKQMAALDQNTPSLGYRDFFSGSDHIQPGMNAKSTQTFGLGNIGGNQVGQGHQLCF